MMLKAFNRSLPIRALYLVICLVFSSEWISYDSETSYLGSLLPNISMPSLHYVNADVPTRQNLYSVLGIKKNASLTDIKKAYRRMSMKYHPDKNKDPSAENKFKEITFAYEILSNEEKRGIYDTQGIDGIERMNRNGGPDDGGHPFDIFSDFFGFGGHGRGREETPKVPPTEMKLRVSLEQLYKGSNLNFMYTRSALCIDADECTIRKPDCKGPGVRVITQQMGPGFLVQNQIADSSCIQNGKAWKPNCKACPNGLYEPETVRLDANIRPGMSAGEKIEIDGMGEQRIGHEPGDIIFVIEEIPHKRYRREGADLHMEMRISLADALLGFSNEFEHIDGNKVEIKQKGISPDGHILTIPNRGMPYRGNHQHNGHLFITLRVKYPTSLTSKQQGLIKEALVE